MGRHSRTLVRSVGFLLSLLFWLSWAQFSEASILPPTPSPLPNSTEKEPSSDLFRLLDSLIETFDTSPYLLAFIAAATVVGTSVIVYFSVIGILRAGKTLPPEVAVTMVLGIVTIITLVAVAIRPNDSDMVALGGAAVGALAATTTLAWQQRGQWRKDERGTEEERGTGAE